MTGVAVYRPAWAAHVDLPLKILCFGSRDWSGWYTIYSALRWFSPGTVLVHGANGKIDLQSGLVACGADLMAAQVGAGLGFEIRPYSADWSKGRRAGPARNRLMVKKEHTEQPEQPISLALGFHPDLASSKGSKDMAGVLFAAKIQFWVIKTDCYDFDYCGG